MLILFLAAPLIWADLAAVKSEPNLERRSEKALDNANTALDAARTAYKSSDLGAFKVQLNEVEESGELSYQSLKDTGKAARNSPKYFKRAEMKLHALSNRLKQLSAEVGMDERAEVESVRKKLGDLEDKLLLEIMTKKH